MEALRSKTNLFSRTMGGFLEKTQSVLPRPEKCVRDSHVEAEEKLMSFVRSLHSPSLVDSLNHRLVGTTNSRKRAADLCDYYRGNPNLKTLTLSKEVPRLSFEFTLDGGKKLTKPDEIQKHFDERVGDEMEELVLRAANQTLMADVLAVLAGDSRVVERKFLASAVATHCHFFVNLDVRSESERKYAKCWCDFLICIPGGADGRGRLALASIRASAFFSPGMATGKGRPLLRYRVHSIEPCPECKVQQFKDAAKWLATHLHHEEHNTHCAPAAVASAKQQPSFDLGFNFSFKKPRLDIASTVRSVAETISSIDGQTAAAVASKRNTSQQNNVLEQNKLKMTTVQPLPSTSTSLDYGMAGQPVTGVALGDAMVEQLIIEQNIILSQIKATNSAGVGNRNGSEPLERDQR